MTIKAMLNASPWHRAKVFALERVVIGKRLSKMWSGRRVVRVGETRPSATVELRDYKR